MIEERFKSVKEAAEKTGINKTAISMVINGVRNKDGGYSWKSV